MSANRPKAFLDKILQLALCEQGSIAPEYSLTGALIALAIVGSIVILGGDVQQLYAVVASMYPN